MNTLDSLHILNTLTANLADISHATIRGNSFTDGISTSKDLCIHDNITIGSHTFKAEQLGQLFNFLLSQYPELSL